MKNFYFFVLSFLIFKVTAQNACYVNPVYTSTLPSIGLTSADYNGDGYQDLASASNSLAIQYGSGAGKFLPPVSYVHGLTNMTSVSDVTSGDFNGDGKIDIAVSSYTNKVAVLFNSTTGFGSPQIYTIGGGGQDLLTSDVNGDGKLDLLTLNGVNNGVSILLNNGAGSFPLISTFTLQAFPQSFTAGDFDNNGSIDIAVTSTLNAIDVFLNNGAGVYSPTTSVSTATYGSSLGVGDVNNDGKMDLAVSLIDGSLAILHGSGNGTFTTATSFSLGSNGGSSTTIIKDINGDGAADIVSSGNRDVLSVLLNNGSGVFSKSSWVSTLFTMDIVLNDFTGDGRPDVVTTFGGSPLAGSVLINNGSGGFFTTRAHKVVGDAANNLLKSVHAADLDNDGKTDILTSDNNNNSFSVLYGNGAGDFSVTVYPTSGVSPISGTTADFNNDGLLDVAVVGYTNSVGIYLNNGNRTFTQYATYPTGVFPWLIDAKDMNNDGKMDVIITNYGSNNISIRLGAGTGSLGAQATYAVAGNAMGVAVADYNNDGFKDVAVAAWNNSITVFSGSSTGALGAGTGYIVTSVPHGITTGDFNGDGAPDLAINCGYSNSFAVKLNNGSGTFGANANYNIGYTSESIICGDYNLDGKLDIAVGSQQSGTVLKIYNGNGLGNFLTPTSYLVGESPYVITSGDFNSDGVPDFASACSFYVGVLLTASMPTLSIGGSTLGCSLAPLTLTANGAQTYAWSSGSFGGVSTSTYFPTSSQVVTVTALNSPLCPASATHSITVIPSPTVVITSSSPSLCSGATATLVASGAPSYTWNTNNTSSSITVSPQITTTYSATGIGNNGCKHTVGQQVSVNPTPTLLLTNDTTICAGGSAGFTVSGAPLYAWSQGSVGATVMLTPTTNSCYTVTGWINSCTAEAVACVTVSALPQIQVSPASATVCNGTSQTFTASGAQSYSWSGNVNTATNTILSGSTSTYAVTGFSNGCSSVLQGTLTVDPGCSDVWPGDANSDGVVSGSDVMELGLGFLSTGSARPAASNNYVAQYAQNWTGTVSTNKNLCHADCNGDGVIDANDTLAIFNNFSLTHSFKPAPAAAEKMGLVHAGGTLVQPGTWCVVQVRLFDANSETVYGTYFDVDFDVNVTEPDSVYLRYVPSFINANNTNVEFRKLNSTQGKLHSATVRTDKANATGSGQIAELRFKLKQGLPDNTDVILNLSACGGVLANGMPSAITGGTLHLRTDNSLGIINYSNRTMVVYPNPATEKISIRDAGETARFQITDLTGRIMMEGEFSNNTDLNIVQLSEGGYFLSVNSSTASITRKVMVSR